MSKREEDLDREIRDHLELEAEEQAGLSGEEARRAARRAFGNTTLIREVTREMWRWASIERVRQDMQYGLRLWRRSPGFTVVATLTLALGIGANTAIFSVVNAVLLRPLPFPGPERLVRLWESHPKKGYSRNVVNPLNFLDWRERSHSFESMAAILSMTANLTGIGEPEAAPRMSVSPEFFSVLGVSPWLGRAFVREEEIPGRNRSVILSFGFWQSHFAANRGVLGKKIMVDGKPLTVVGVMPRGFAFPGNKAELWTPMALARTEEFRGGRYLTAVARLKRGVTLQQARDDIAAIAIQTARERPFMNRDWSAEVVPLLADVTWDVRLPLFVLLAAVALVLLIACANVANLLLMRASGRFREVAVRSALGAGKARIVQQLLSESLLLAVAGWAAGLAFARWGVRGLLAIIPASTPLPRMESIHVDAQVFGFAFLISLVTALFFGVIPAIQISRVEIQDALRQGSLRTGVGGNRTLRRAFVVAEIALALVLLAGAGLMIRSFSRLISVNPGFEPEHLLTVGIFTSPAKYQDDQRRSRYLEQVLGEIRRVPGVKSAGSVHFLPLTGLTSGSCFAPADQPPPDTSSPGAEFLIVTPGYFETMGTPMLSGRNFGERDQWKSPSVIVVNQAFAQRFYPGRNPIGKRLNVCWNLPNPGEIIGVISNARQSELQTAPKPTIFLANAQVAMYFASIVVRTSNEPRQMARAVQNAIHRIDREQAVSGVATMEDVLSDSISQPRFQVVLLAAFAAMAVVLAVIGVYGVVSYSVNQRTQEIGIRVALGARTGDVAGLVLREGLLLAGIGTAVGLAGALAFARVLRTLLYEVRPADPVTLIAGSFLLLLVASAATWIPARRATKVDPVTALRYE